MFIKYENYELLELFLSEPVSLTDNEGDGEISYSKISEKGFKLNMFIHTYELKCEMFLSFNDENIFDAELLNITEILKKEQMLVFKAKEIILAKIVFGKNFRISMNPGN